MMIQLPQQILPLLSTQFLLEHGELQVSLIQMLTKPAILQGIAFFNPSNGKLTASNSSNTYTGSWSVTKDDSNDDNPSNDLDFNIAFTSPENFVDLTDDWNIVSRTDTKIQLVSVSGGGGGTDYLTFEKN